MSLEQSLTRAVANISQHGDTDIFPFPIENRIIFDSADKIKTYLLEADKDFDKFLTAYPPANYGTLAPVGYTGFRWATQIDPLWNVYFLGLVIELPLPAATPLVDTRAGRQGVRSLMSEGLSSRLLHQLLDDLPQL